MISFHGRVLSQSILVVIRKSSREWRGAEPLAARGPMPRLNIVLALRVQTCDISDRDLALISPYQCNLISCADLNSL
jgi:hypothetical protein